VVKTWYSCAWRSFAIPRPMSPIETMPTVGFIADDDEDVPVSMFAGLSRSMARSSRGIYCTSASFAPRSLHGRKCLAKAVVIIRTYTSRFRLRFPGRSFSISLPLCFNIRAKIHLSCAHIAPKTRDGRPRDLPKKVVAYVSV
jgi:hypothetical protein